MKGGVDVTYYYIKGQKLVLWSFEVVTAMDGACFHSAQGKVEQVNLSISNRLKCVWLDQHPSYPQDRP